MAEESDLKLRTRYLCEVDGAVQLSDSPFGESTLATWHDIECSRGEDDIAAVRELIANECRVNADEVDSNDVDKAAIDLAEPDHWPEVTHFGVIRKLSATCIAPGDIGDASAKDPLFICGNRVEVAMGPKWVVSAWHTTEQISPRGSLLRPLPDVLPAARIGMVDAVEELIDDYSLAKASDLGLAILACSVGTFSDSRKQLHRQLDAWEHDYYERNFRQEDSEEPADGDLRAETRTLASIHSAGVDLSRELDMLTAPRDRSAGHWVGNRRASPQGEALAQTADEKIDRYRRSLRDLRDRVRAALDLSHNVETGKRDQAARRRDTRIAKLAALFLAPTLVAGFYGINTSYPDYGTQRGTLEALLLMILSAVLAWWAIVWLDRRDDKRRTTKRRRSHSRSDE